MEIGNRVVSTSLTVLKFHGLYARCLLAFLAALASAAACGQQSYVEVYLTTPLVCSSANLSYAAHSEGCSIEVGEATRKGLDLILLNYTTIIAGPDLNMEAYDGTYPAPTSSGVFEIEAFDYCNDVGTALGRTVQSGNLWYFFDQPGAPYTTTPPPGLPAFSACASPFDTSSLVVLDTLSWGFSAPTFGSVEVHPEGTLQTQGSLTWTLCGLHDVTGGTAYAGAVMMAAYNAPCGVEVNWYQEIGQWNVPMEMAPGAAPGGFITTPPDFWDTATGARYDKQPYYDNNHPPTQHQSCNCD